MKSLPDKVSPAAYLLSIPSRTSFHSYSWNTGNSRQNPRAVHHLPRKYTVLPVVYPIQALLEAVPLSPVLPPFLIWNVPHLPELPEKQGKQLLKRETMS